MVRKATLSDLTEVALLFNDYRVWYKKDADVEGALQFIKERLDRNESVILVSENKGVIEGFTQLYPLFSSIRMRRIWLLNDLFVHPDKRGRGISKSLIEAAKDLCTQTNAAGLLLETDKTNIIGNQLYPATGFELCKDTNFYWWTHQA